MTKKNLILTSVGIVAGGIAGYAYYYFIGCKNGCPIQSNALLTTLYGAFTGAVATFSFKKNKKNEENERNRQDDQN
ncbi:MAG: hypothetical protein B6D45_02320 [Ignavibacteriales bacterium UTCHB3]|nr:MAG: hypothetical protein B6D45_02320 [Ignavibacteriales bacterium UTCHB3]